MAGREAYPVALAGFTARSLGRLVRAPARPRASLGRRRLARQTLGMIAGTAALVVILMLTLDVPVISAMPVRGAPQLWPARFITDFGKSEYVLWACGALALLTVIVAPALSGVRRAQWAALGVRLSFIFLAVAIPNLVGEVLKGLIGRGRPFVGGAANAFNFSPLTWSPQFASLPSAHAITAFSLAFAVAAVWPRTRFVMMTYAVLIILSRIVLLAHHPSDVVAGGVVGVIGAMAVRQWFAARRLGFVIAADGRVEPLPGPSIAALRGVAVGPAAS
ncbi:phosphatase PAP2 family protein [Bradyrhizobium sp. 2TAF24]|uniref:phosphatase PAP2 family protein n=1 Tax=Bradyrhizobium sp. 2TAF24 TaxID=3233011 RepID=UPI003F8E8937